MGICYRARSTAQHEDEKVEWWIALQNVKLFHHILRNDLDVVARSLLSRANDAETPQRQVQSIEDVKLEYTRLTMKYYQQPEVWNRENIPLNWSWIVPNKKSAHSPFDPVEDDESPHSIQSTILDSYASERQPEVPSDFYNPPPRPSQFPSTYNPALAFISLPTTDGVETGCAALASLDQPFPTPTYNAAGRGSLPPDYTYRFDPTAPHNHVEIPSSYGSRAYPSKPCGYVNMPSSSTSCVTAQPAPTSGNWVSSLPPTAVQAYNESSYYHTEAQFLCSDCIPYMDSPVSTPDWSRFPVDRDLPLSHDEAKGVEDSNRPAQSYFEPLIFNGPGHRQPVLNRAQFDHANLSRPQKSQDDLPHYNWAQSQPALNTAQFDQRPQPRPATPYSILDSYSELPPFDNLTQWQPPLNRVQFDHSQPPRPAVSSRSIQSYVDQPSIYEIPRQPVLNLAQFEPVRRVPATRNNPIRVEAFNGSRSYLEQTVGDTAYPLQPSRTVAAAPANYNVNLMSSSYNDTHDNPSPAYVFPSRSSLLLGGLANQDVVNFQRWHHQGALKK